MTIREMTAKYPNGELTAGKGDKEFRYLLLSTLFNNLYQNKVVYHERCTSIVKLENIIISPDGFHANAKLHLLIDKGCVRKRPIPQQWNIGANWEYLRVVGDCLNPYSGWLMWVDPLLVEKVERLTVDRDFDEALDLTMNGI